MEVPAPADYHRVWGSHTSPTLHPCTREWLAGVEVQTSFYPKAGLTLGCSLYPSAVHGIRLHLELSLKRCPCFLLPLPVSPLPSWFPLGAAPQWAHGSLGQSLFPGEERGHSMHRCIRCCTWIYLYKHFEALLFFKKQKIFSTVSYLFHFQYRFKYRYYSHFNWSKWDSLTSHQFRSFGANLFFFFFLFLFASLTGNWMGKSKLLMEGSTWKASNSFNISHLTYPFCYDFFWHWVELTSS